MKKINPYLPLVSAVGFAIGGFIIGLVFLKTNIIDPKNNPFGSIFSGIVIWSYIYSELRGHLENGRYAHPSRDVYLTVILIALSIVPMSIAYSFASQYEPDWLHINFQNPLILSVLNAVALCIVAAITLSRFDADAKIIK